MNVSVSRELPTTATATAIATATATASRVVCHKVSVHLPGNVTVFCPRVVSRYVTLASTGVTAGLRDTNVYGIILGKSGRVCLADRDHNSAFRIS